MAQLLVRNIPAALVEALKQRAARRGTSAEAEHRAILEGVLGADHGAFWERAARLKDQTRGRMMGEAVDLIREDRDRR